jgi:hypothetical protein
MKKNGLLQSVNSMIILSFLLIPEYLFPQEMLGKIFHEKKEIKKVQYSHGVINGIIAGSKDIAVLSCPGRFEDQARFVTLYDLEGNELWSKEIMNAQRFSIGKNANKIVVIHSFQNDRVKNICYDLAGNQLWEIETNDPGLTISDDGKYGIITGITSEEQGGKFKAYNLSDGTEIATPIGKDYNWFYAKFLNDDEVVVLLQKMVLIKDEEKLRDVEKRIKEYRNAKIEEEQLRKEKGIEKKNDLKKRKKIDPEYIRLVNKRQSYVKHEILPLKFIIYNIPSNSIRVGKDLFAINGEKLWVDIIGSNYIETPNDGENIILKTGFGDYNAYLKSPSLAISLYNKNGDQIWENSNLGPIKGMKNLNNDCLVVNGGLMNSTISLLDMKTGQLIGKYTHSKSIQGPIQDCILRDNFIYIQSYYNFNLDRSFQSFFIDFKSGQSILDLDQNEDIIINVTAKGQDVMFNKITGQIFIMK